MQKLKYEQAFEKLLESASPFGVDLLVEGPVEILMRTLKLSRYSTLRILKELEVRRMVVSNRFGVGNLIESVRILKKRLPDRLYEEEELTRLAKAIRKWARPSKFRPGVQILHAAHFSEVRAEADLQEAPFYLFLGHFEKQGLLLGEKKKHGGNRYLYVELTQAFFREMIKE